MGVDSTSVATPPAGHNTYPLYNESDSSHIQSNSNFPLLLPLTQSNSSPCPVPPSFALSQPSLFGASTPSPPLTLSSHLHGQCSYHQDELACSPGMQPLALPLAPPAAPPSTIRHLPINLDAHTLALTHSPLERQPLLDNSQSFLHPFTSTQRDPTFFHRPSPYLRITTSSEVAAIQPKSAEAERLLLKSKVCNPLACGVGIPFVGSFGIEHDYNTIAVDLLDPSLEDIFHLCNLVPTDHPPSLSNTPFPSLAHLIIYSLCCARLMSPIISTALYLLQRLKARFIAACGSSRNHLFISAL